MCRVIAICNLKGGVAKTTTTVNLAAALAERSRRVLAIDLDPQASLTFAVGLKPSQLTATLKDALEERAVPLSSMLQQTPDKFQIIPANHSLNKTANRLEKSLRISALRSALEPLQSRFDFILLDCPANAGVLTGIALAAAGEIVIPFTADYLALQSLNWLMMFIQDLHQVVNPNLRITGIFCTMHDPRTHHARTITDIVREQYGTQMPFLSTNVRASVGFKEATLHGKSILLHSPASAGAESYRALAREIDEGIRQTPENEVYILLEQGKVALTKRDMTAAYSSFSRASDLRPTLADAWLGRAESAPEWEERVRCYSRALQASPSSAVIRHSLEQCLQDGISQKGRASIAELVTGGACLEQAGETAMARRLYDHAVELDPRHEQALLGLARVATDQKEAILFIQRCLAVYPDSVLAKDALEQTKGKLINEASKLVDRGNVQIKLGAKTEAHALFIQATNLDPANENAWLGAAQTCPDRRGALSLVKRALKLNPVNASARKLLIALSPPETLAHGVERQWQHLIRVLKRE